MATGSGKSIIYQIPALLKEKPSICISPLISLMQDQVIKLNESVGKVRNSADPNIAVFFGSSSTGNTNDCELEKRKIEKALRGDYLFIYMSPEKIECGGLQILKDIARARNGLSCIAIDEAHCVSEWGCDFRPSYLQLGAIREAFSESHFNYDIPIVALTATAPVKVQSDIMKSLKLRLPETNRFVHYQGDLYRKNLTFEVRKNVSAPGKYSSLDFVLDDLLNDSQESAMVTRPPTIIYANSKFEVDSI